MGKALGCRALTNDEYIIYFVNGTYFEYDRKAKTNLPIDRTDASYRCASGFVFYSVLEMLENETIILEKNGKIYAHHLGSREVVPLKLGGKLTTSDRLHICSFNGKI